MVNQEETYDPPVATGTGVNRTKYGYNLDRQTVLTSRPDGQTIGYEYDTMGRLVTVTLPGGEIAYSYDADTDILKNIIAPDNGTM